MKKLLFAAVVCVSSFAFAQESVSPTKADVKMAAFLGMSTDDYMKLTPAERKEKQDAKNLPIATSIGMTLEQYYKTPAKIRKQKLNERKRLDVQAKFVKMNPDAYFALTPAERQAKLDKANEPLAKKLGLTLEEYYKIPQKERMERLNALKKAAKAK